MKNALIFPFCLILLFSCSIDDENKSFEKIYTNSMGTSLTITKANWRKSVESSYVGITGGLSFLSTILNVSGRTNGDSIKINGVFTTGWNTMDSPGVLGGIVYLYFHMNWGGGGSHDGWFAFNDVNSGNGNYKYARQDFYITKP